MAYGFNTGGISMPSVDYGKVTMDKYSYGGDMPLSRVNLTGPGSWNTGKQEPTWWEQVITGAEKESSALTDKLKGIYDNYTGSAGDYEANLKPLLEGLEGDIAGLTDWMKGYEDLLAEIKPTMMGGLQIDPTAANYRNQYMGAVGSQYDQAEEQMRRQMSQQGINPYSNTGATRDVALNRAGAMAGAANQAYSDWREDYNKNMQAQQAAQSQYAQLYGKTGDYFGDIMSARAGMGNLYKGIYDTNLQAQMARAQGYEGLLGLEQQKWQTGLAAGQQQSMMDLQKSMFNAQLASKHANDQEWKPAVVRPGGIF
jgi:hypothetical protein